MAKTITEKDAAAEIGISRSHLVNLRKRGEGPPYIKAGSRVLYRPESIDNWLMSSETSDPDVSDETEETAEEDTPEVEQVEEIPF